MSRSNQVFDKGYAVVADFNGTPFSVHGGHYVLGGFGTFGAGTLKLQWTSDNDATWIDIGTQNAIATQLTAAGTTDFDLPPGRYRVILTGSTAPALQYWFGQAHQSS